MKRLIFTLITAVAVMASAAAMSYSQAREQALFLTDKMAYELNLTYDQYNAAYEINLDYIMCIDVAGDLFGTYWNRRNTELSYVLTAAQYRAFTTADYFYRPVTWSSNKFRFVIYERYSKDKYYRAAPAGYQTYKGSNRYYDHSAYVGRNYGTSAGHSQVGNSKGHSQVVVKDHGAGNPYTDRGVLGGASRRPDGHGSAMTKKQAVNQGKEDMKNRRR